MAVPKTSEGAVMNRIHHIRRLGGTLAGLAGALLAVVWAAPAALARPVPPPGLNNHPPPLPPEHAVAPVYHPAQYAAAGGMPGWAVILIAVGAALLAATAAVLADRAWAGRRRAITPAA
jgi:hypothetical protein